MHAISSCRGNRPTHPQTNTSSHKQTRQDRLQYTAPQPACNVINNKRTNKQTTTLVLTVSFWETWISQCKPVPKGQTILDFAAARDDGDGSGDNWNS